MFDLLFRIESLSKNRTKGIGYLDVSSEPAKESIKDKIRNKYKSYWSKDKDSNNTQLLAEDQSSADEKEPLMDRTADMSDSEVTVFSQGSDAGSELYGLGGIEDEISVDSLLSKTAVSAPTLPHLNARQWSRSKMSSGTKDMYELEMITDELVPPFPLPDIQDVVV